MKVSVTDIRLQRSEGTFHAALAAIRGDLSALLSKHDLLHPAEKKIFGRFRFNARKKSYLLGRLSAKEALNRLAKIDKPESIWIDSGIFHFPIVKCPEMNNLSVCISHCDDVGLCLAFPDAHPMGLDIELVDPEQLDAILLQTADSELELLKEHGLDTIQGYTAFWSVKEALSKILKTGLMLDFKIIKIQTIERNGAVIETTFKYFGQYKAYSYMLNDKYVVSLALPGRSAVNLEAVWEMLDQLEL